MRNFDKSILVIDSDPAWLEFGSTALETSQYQVYVASSQQALESLFTENPQLKVDLTFVDANTLKTNPTIFDRLQQTAGTTPGAIVALFAIDLGPKQIHALFKLGVFDCVNKPFDEVTLLALVEQTLADYRLKTTQLEPLPAETLKILIVDDDEDWQNFLTHYLPKATIDVDRAINYTDAVEKVLNYVYDLIIFDLRLDDADDTNFRGIELIHLVRQKDEQTESVTPLIVISAYGTPEHIRDSFRSYGINYYFDKKYLSPSQYHDAIIEALT